MSDFNPGSAMSARFGECIRRNLKNPTGILLLSIAVVVILINEFRCMLRYDSIMDDLARIVTISADRPDPINEGKQVYAAGFIYSDDSLYDPDFCVTARAVLLKRKVQMFQWKEVVRSDYVKNDQGKFESQTLYSYQKEWDPTVINNSIFHESQGHENPKTMPFGDTDFQASNFRLGAFTIRDEIENLLTDIGEDLFIPVSPSEKPNENSQIFHIIDNKLYHGKDIKNPKVGDILIEFKMLPCFPVSMIAVQKGMVLEAIPEQENHLIRLGSHAAEDILLNARKENILLTWALRILGFVLMFSGLIVTFRMFIGLDLYESFMQDITESGMIIVTFMIAAALSFMLISFVWLHCRPYLASALLGIAFSFIFGIKILPKQQK